VYNCRLQLTARVLSRPSVRPFFCDQLSVRFRIQQPSSVALVTSVRPTFFGQRNPQIQEHGPLRPRILDETLALVGRVRGVRLFAQVAPTGFGDLDGVLLGGGLDAPEGGVARAVADTLGLVEAGDGVADVGGVVQRLLPLFRGGEGVGGKAACRRIRQIPGIGLSILTRNKAQPCCEISPLAECSAVVDGGNAWMNALEARTPRNVLVVAMANKLARIAWAVLSS
jgi:hypothetical protein